MKKIIYTFIFSIIFLSSCKKENALTPSFADQLPLSDQLDLSQPQIKAYSENYGIGIVYKYRDTTDFRFAFNDRNSVAAWNRIIIKKVDPAKVAYSLKMLDSLVLKYFKDELVFQGQVVKNNFKKQSFPRHLFLADSLAGAYSNTGQYLGEPNLYETDKYYSFLWNGYEPVFAFNKGLLDKADKDGILKYRNSILYSFINQLFISKGIPSEFPASFYDKVNDLYGMGLNAIAKADGAALLDGTGGRKYYAPAWYSGRGFGMTNQSPASTGAYVKDTRYTTALDTTKTIIFPDRLRDFRNLVHILICEDNLTQIRTYLSAAVFKSRMRVLIQEMYRRGVDVYAINPAAKEYYVD